MQTIRHTRGTNEDDPLVLTDNGQPLDLTGCTVTAHISVGTACMTLAATIPVPLLGEAWMAWESLDLPARAYRGKLTVTWPSGRISPAGRFVLVVEGAC